MKNIKKTEKMKLFYKNIYTEEFSKNRGITLVALVITIIILLILAGITLATIAGDNGLLKRAIEAKEETKYGIAEENGKIAVNASYGESGSIEKESLKENINK